MVFCTVAVPKAWSKSAPAAAVLFAKVTLVRVELALNRAPPPLVIPVPVLVLPLIVLFVITGGPLELEMPAPWAKPGPLTLLPLIVLRRIVRSVLTLRPPPAAESPESWPVPSIELPLTVLSVRVSPLLL